MRTPKQSYHVNPISVAELTEQIKSKLESSFDHVVVEGELSALNAHRSGHVYLTLKDDKARIDGVVWRSTVQRLSYRPGTGEYVLVRGRLNVYAPQGSYKLIVEGIEPIGLGRLQAQFEALKAKLASNGLFDESRKLKLPFLPKGVGLVTSATGAARRDIESVIARRSPQIPIYLAPASVQGRGAAKEIAKAIRRLDQSELVDVIIVGRGGGSIEDLWAFNEEVVALAIAGASKPIISAVGHETDFTIADYVADCRAPTPSVGAELAVPVRDDLNAHIAALSDAIDRLIRYKAQTERSRLDVLAQRLSRSVSLGHLKLPVEKKRNELHRATNALVSRKKTRLVELTKRLYRVDPRIQLGVSKNRLEQATLRLAGLCTQHFERSKQRLGVQLYKLNALSPLASLSRGYSITRHGTTLVQRASDVDIGDNINVLVLEGTIHAAVTKVELDEDQNLQD